MGKKDRWRGYRNENVPRILDQIKKCQAQRPWGLCLSEQDFVMLVFASSTIRCHLQIILGREKAKNPSILETLEEPQEMLSRSFSPEFKSFATIYLCDPLGLLFMRLGRWDEVMPGRSSPGHSICTSPNIHPHSSLTISSKSHEPLKTSYLCVPTTEHWRTWNLCSNSCLSTY